RGATLGLIGPNGSGKSTFMRLAAGIEPADGGELQLLGRDPRQAVERIGWLAEGCPYPAELPGPTVLHLLDQARGGDRRARRARVGEWIERVGLTGAGRTPIGRFSSGMRRRFGLAAACMHSPDVLLLDEPSSGLDAEGAALLEALLAEARARAASTLVCSHLPSDLHAACDALAVLIEGRIATVEAPARLAERVERVELEVEATGERTDLDVVGLEAELERRGGRLRATRPTATALARLYADLASGTERG
ncbi:MAG: ABC transporter ATP-binding protein, partial [Planctomycetota bacterium]